MSSPARNRLYRRALAYLTLEGAGLDEAMLLGDANSVDLAKLPPQNGALC